MVEFYVNLTKYRIKNGMSREEALEKVPVKWRDAVDAVLEAEQNSEESEQAAGGSDDPTSD